MGRDAKGIISSINRSPDQLLAKQKVGAYLDRKIARAGSASQQAIRDRLAAKFDVIEKGLTRHEEAAHATYAGVLAAPKLVSIGSAGLQFVQAMDQPLEMMRSELKGTANRGIEAAIARAVPGSAQEGRLQRGFEQINTAEDRDPLSARAKLVGRFISANLLESGKDDLDNKQAIFAALKVYQTRVSANEEVLSGCFQTWLQGPNFEQLKQVSSPPAKPRTKFFTAIRHPLTHLT